MTDETATPPLKGPRALLARVPAWLARLLRFRRVAPARAGWLWFALGDASWKLSTFLVLSMVSRHFAGAGADAFVLSQTATALLIATGDLGFRVLGTRHIALASDARSVRAIIRTVQRRRVAAALALGTPVVAVAVFTLADDARARLSMGCIALCFFPYFLQYDWALLALRRFERLTLSRIATIAVLLLTVALSAQLALPIEAVGAGYALGFLAARVVAVSALPEASPRVADADANALSWRTSLTLAVALAATALFHTQEVLLAGWWLGSTRAASFGAAFRLLLTACSISWLFTQYLSPRLARVDGATHARLRAYAAPLFAWGVVACLAVLALGDVVARLVYHDAFPDVAPTLRSLAPIIALDALASLFGTVLVMQGRGRAAVLSTLLGVAGSALAFTLCASLSIVEGMHLPIVAKYAGYACLLVAQVRYAFGPEARR